MVEIEDIVDRESLRAWLEKRPQRDSMIIVHRAAMRALPMYWNHVLPSAEMLEGDLDIIPVLRACLISGAGAYFPFAGVNPRLVDASILAAFRAPTNLSLTLTSDERKITKKRQTPIHPDVDNATTAAYSAAKTVAASSSVEAAAIAAHTAVASSGAWNEIQFDCILISKGEDLSRVPIWGSGEKQLREEWAEVKAGLSKEHIDWQFWIKWYEAALLGRPLPWKLLVQIALEMREGDWAQEREYVNGKIAEIEAAYLRDTTRLIEKLVVDGTSGEVFAEPAAAKRPELIETHLNRIADALTRALNNNNGLTDDSLETQILRDLVSKYSHDPERVEMDLVEVVGSLNRQIESDWLPDSPVINSLLNACRQGALDIRAMNPELAENRAIRARQAARELSVEDKAKLESGIEVIKPLLRADLREQFEGDLQRLLNDAIGPPPEGAPPLPAPDPAMRLANRVAKVSLMVRVEETVKKIKKHPFYGAGEVALTLSGLVALFYTVFSLIG